MDHPALVTLLFSTALQLITALSPRVSRSARAVLITLSWAGIIYSLTAFALWGAMAMRWTVPIWAAILAGAILGGASGAFAWKQAMPSENEKRLRADMRELISSGETARDNWITERRMLISGQHNAHVVKHRERQIEEWRERLGQIIAQQKVLRIDDTTAFVTTTEGDRISGSITALKVLLRDWRSFAL